MHIPILHISAMKVCSAPHFQRYVDMFSCNHWVPAIGNSPGLSSSKLDADNTTVQEGTYKWGIIAAILDKAHLQFAISAITNSRILIFLFVCFLCSIWTSRNVTCPNIPFSFSLSSGDLHPYLRSWSKAHWRQQKSWGQVQEAKVVPVHIGVVFSLFSVFSSVK